LEKVLMYFAEITTNPKKKISNFTRITARRKNGDQCFIFGQDKSHVFAIKRILMKLARSFRVIPMADLADFIGLGGINTTNEELINCLSVVPNAYAGVDLHAAVVAWKRDYHITARVLAQNPSVDQITACSDNQEDWVVFWRCNCPVPEIREHLAQELAEGRTLKADNRRRLEERKANGGQAH
jgi:hypothetical protein